MAPGFASDDTPARRFGGELTPIEQAVASAKRQQGAKRAAELRSAAIEAANAPPPEPPARVALGARAPAQQAPPATAPPAASRPQPVRAALRPATAAVSKFALRAGLDENMGSGLRLGFDHTLAAAAGSAPTTFGLSANANLGRESCGLAMRLLPATVAQGVAVEVGLAGANLSEVLGPCQRSLFGALSLTDLTGRHALRFQAAARDLLPSPTASAVVKRLPLSTSKASIGYRYLCDTRPAKGAAGELRHASVEVSGLLGDVQLLRAEGAWKRFAQIFGGGMFTLTLAGGLARPLGPDATLPLEDRFFLGGTFGQSLGEHLPGFAGRGAGPSAPRSAPEAGSPRERDQRRTIWSFGRDWQAVRRDEARPEEPAPAPVASDPLGGAARALASASAVWPLTVPGLGLRASAFATGSVGALVGEVRPSLFQDMGNEWRASVAAGVAAHLPKGGMLGLCCAQPLLWRPGDEQRQLSVWLSFDELL